MKLAKILTVGCAALIGASVTVAPDQAWAGCKKNDYVCEAKEKAKKSKQAAKEAAAAAAERTRAEAAEKSRQAAAAAERARAAAAENKALKEAAEKTKIEFNKFKSAFNQKKISREECLKILGAATGATKLSKEEEEFFKTFLSQKKTNKGRSPFPAAERQEFRDFFEQDSISGPTRTAVNNIRNNRETIKKIFTPKNMCEKSGNWFVAELSKIGVIPEFSFKKVDEGSGTFKNFALHDSLFSPAIAAPSAPQPKEFFGWGIAFDAALILGVTAGFEVVTKLANHGGLTNEVHTYLTTAPTIGAGGGVDVAMGFMWYGNKGLAPANWDSFPGWGSTTEVGPEIPSPVVIGPGVNYISSSPFGSDTMGRGFSIGAGVSVGIFSFAPYDYTWQVK